MHCVKETKKGLAFPPQIPQQRGARGIIAIISASVLFLLGGCLAVNNRILFIAILTSCLLLTIIFEEFVCRFCLLFEEWKHLKSRYNNNKMTLFHDVFYFTWLSWTVFIMSLFTLLGVYLTIDENPFKAFFQENYISILCAFISMSLLCKVLKLEKSPLYDSLQFTELEGTDYGSGMAHSFFHGYLRIVLPHTGLQHDKGIREFQRDFEATNNIQFDVYKLFILIPMSQHCPPSLDSEFSPSVEASKELDSKGVDRAGVKNRNYKNSVYKINTQNGKKKYVTAEYATPVKTLWEVMKENTPCANMYMKHRKEILLNFYLTLLDLIKNDEDCRDICEVIYYDDKNANGEYRDVGEVILHRIRDLVKKTN